MLTVRALSCCGVEVSQRFRKFSSCIGVYVRHSFSTCDLPMAYFLALWLERIEPLSVSWVRNLYSTFSKSLILGDFRLSPSGMYEYQQKSNYKSLAFSLQLLRLLIHATFILSLCNFPVACRSTRMQRALRDLALPIIYRTVDLSVHDRPLTFDQEWWRDFNNALVLGDEYPCTWFLLEPLAVKQQSSLHTLLQNPSLGAHVRTFVWTIRDNWGPAGPLPDKPGYDRPRFKALSRHADMGSFSKSHQGTTPRLMLKPQELRRAISSYAIHETLFNRHKTLPFWGHVSPDGRLYSGFHQFFRYENSRSQCLARPRPF